MISYLVRLSFSRVVHDGSCVCSARGCGGAVVVKDLSPTVPRGHYVFVLGWREDCVSLHATGIAECVLTLQRKNSLPTLTRTSSRFGCIMGFEKTKRKAGTLVTRLVNKRVTHALKFEMPRVIFLGLSRTFKQARTSRRVRSLLR